MPGFASTKATTTRRVWFSLYSRDDEHQPIAVNRVTLPLLSGQTIFRASVLHAQAVLQQQPDVWEVIAHRGPTAIPRCGDDVLARICREPFRHCKRLG